MKNGEQLFHEGVTGANIAVLGTFCRMEKSAPSDSLLRAARRQPRSPAPKNAFTGLPRNSSLAGLCRLLIFASPCPLLVRSVALRSTAFRPTTAGNKTSVSGTNANKPEDGLSDELRAVLSRQRARIDARSKAGTVLAIGDRSTTTAGPAEGPSRNAPAAVDVDERTSTKPVIEGVAAPDSFTATETAKGTTTSNQHPGVSSSELSCCSEPDAEPEFSSPKREKEESSDATSTAAFVKIGEIDKPSWNTERSRTALHEANTASSTRGLLFARPASTSNAKTSVVTSTKDARASMAVDAGETSATAAEEARQELARRRAALEKCVKSGALTAAMAEKCLQKFSEKMQ